jgi:hypothetical protein
MVVSDKFTISIVVIVVIIIIIIIIIVVVVVVVVVVVDVDRLCGLVIRVSGYRSRGTGFDSRRYQIF